MLFCTRQCQTCSVGAARAGSQPRRPRRCAPLCPAPPPSPTPRPPPQIRLFLEEGGRARDFSKGRPQSPCPSRALARVPPLSLISAQIDGGDASCPLSPQGRMQERKRHSVHLMDNVALSSISPPFFPWRKDEHEITTHVLLLGGRGERGYFPADDDRRLRAAMQLRGLGREGRVHSTHLRSSRSRSRGPSNPREEQTHTESRLTESHTCHQARQGQAKARGCGAPSSRAPGEPEPRLAENTVLSCTLR